MRAIHDHLFALTKTFEDLAKGNYWLYLIPSLIIGLVFWLITSAVSGFFGFLNHANEVPLLGEYLSSGVQATKGFFAYIGDFIYQFFILTILSPVYCLLSEAVDERMTGKKFPFDLGRLIVDFFRMLLIVLISTVMYVTFLGAWWMLSWILGLGFLDQIMSLLIAAFFFGFSFYDYSLERYKIGVGKSIVYSFDKFLYMMLTGILFTLFFQIPFVGVILTPFLTTIVSTIVYLKTEQKLSTNV